MNRPVKIVLKVGKRLAKLRKEVHGFMRFLRLGTVLMKDEEFTKHLKYGDQCLLLGRIAVRRCDQLLPTE